MKTVIDLFCGAGGFSEGFRRAGFKIILGIDKEPRMLAAFRANHLGTEVWERDVLTIDPSELPDADVIIGSPPCQPFSVASSKKDPEKGMILVNWMLDAVRHKKPRFWVMENVPPVVKYLPNWIPVVKILNAVEYGVPQTRKRCFAGDYPLPAPTHCNGPKSQPTIDGRILKRWVTVRDAIGDLPEPLLIQSGANSAQERRMRTPDEPSFTIRADGTQDRYYFISRIAQRNSNMVAGRNRTTDQPSFTVDATMDLALSEEPLAVGKNATRILSEQAVERISKHGLRVQDPDRPAKAVTTYSGGPRTFDTFLACHEYSPNPSPRAIARRGERCGWKRGWDKHGVHLLPLDEPSQTVLGHIGKDGKDFLVRNPDSPATTVQADPRLWPRGHHDLRKVVYRRLTVRECARLQNFPDDYVFVGSLLWQYRQVGEAVPPLMAQRIAEEMLRRW